MTFQDGPLNGEPLWEKRLHNASAFLVTNYHHIKITSMQDLPAHILYDSKKDLSTVNTNNYIVLFCVKRERLI